MLTITGGIVLFGIMFAIAFVQFYIFKNMKAFQSGRSPSIFEQATGIRFGPKECPSWCFTTPERNPEYCKKLGCIKPPFP